MSKEDQKCCVCEGVTPHVLFYEPPPQACVNCTNRVRGLKEATKPSFLIQFENDLFREALKELGCKVSQDVEDLGTCVMFPDGRRLKRVPDPRPLVDYTPEKRFNFES